MPLPPSVHEPTARLVYSDLGLPELFVHAASHSGLMAQLMYLEDLPAELAAHLRRHGLTRATLSTSPLLRKIRLAEAMTAMGIEVGEESGEPHAFVCGCDAAVAETGSLVYRGGLPDGWFRSGVRIAVLEPKDLVPDLIDLVGGQAGEMMLLSGPSAVRVYVLH